MRTTKPKLAEASSAPRSPSRRRRRDLPGAALAQGGDGRHGHGRPPQAPARQGQARQRLGDSAVERPARVVRVIEAANKIAKGKPYCYGGGHASAASPRLRLLGARSATRSTAAASSQRDALGSLMRWGRGARALDHGLRERRSRLHEVAGLRFDTSMTKGDGPGLEQADALGAGYRKRHKAASRTPLIGSRLPTSGASFGTVREAPASGRGFRSLSASPGRPSGRRISRLRPRTVCV